jgi:spermidine/putrescine-binding protein
MFVASIVAVTVAIGSADLTACGDKFLRVGRSARFRGYAAIHPASILFYKPKNSTPAGIKEFEALLKRAGHKSVTVENGTRLSPILAAGEYDVVIADYMDTARIKEELQSVAPNPALLPVLYRPTKAAAAEAEKEYSHFIKPDAMSKHDALAEIDHVMELRLKNTTAADGTR